MRYSNIRVFEVSGTFPAGMRHLWESALGFGGTPNLLAWYHLDGVQKGAEIFPDPLKRNVDTFETPCLKVLVWTFEESVLNLENEYFPTGRVASEFQKNV